MEENNQVTWRRFVPIADVVKFEVVAEGVEEVFEAWKRCFGQVPEAISCCIRS